MYVFFVDAQHIWRSSGVSLHVVIELITAGVSQVARLIHAQNHTFEKSVEVSENLLRRNLLKIPGTDGALHLLQRRIFCGALLLNAEHERMVDLLLRTLHSLRKPFDDVLSIVAENFVQMLKPRTGLVGIAPLDHWWPIEIEADIPLLFDPATL